MKPIHYISGLSQVANDRVLSISVSDQAGIKSDSCSIKFDDRDYLLETPPTGLRIKVFLGWDDSGLVYLGLFEIDEVRFSETQARTMDVTARAQYHENSNVKAPKTQAWDELTLGAIASEIAGRNGYSAEVDGFLAGIWYDHVDQAEESDIHFLSRLAEQYDAYAKFSDGKLLLKPRAVTNGSISVVNNEGVSISGTLNRRNKYKAVKAFWHDSHAARRKSEVAGAGDPMFEIRHTFESKEKAKLAAAAKLGQFERGTGSVDNLVIPGEPNARAEMDLILSGFRPDLNKKWVIRQVSHSYGNGGFSTTLQAEEAM